MNTDTSTDADTIAAFRLVREDGSIVPVTVTLELAHRGRSHFVVRQDGEHLSAHATAVMAVATAMERTGWLHAVQGMDEEETRLAEDWARHFA